MFDKFCWTNVTGATRIQGVHPQMLMVVALHIDHPYHEDVRQTVVLSREIVWMNERISLDDSGWQWGDREEGVDGSGGGGWEAEKCHLPSYDSPVRSIYGTASVSGNLDSNASRWGPYPCGAGERPMGKALTKSLQWPSPDTGTIYEHRVHGKRSTKKSIIWQDAQP